MRLKFLMLFLFVRYVLILIFTANSYRLASFSNLKFKWSHFWKNDEKYIVILLFFCTNLLVLEKKSFLVLSSEPRQFLKVPYFLGIFSLEFLIKMFLIKKTCISFDLIWLSYRTVLIFCWHSISNYNDMK